MINLYAILKVIPTFFFCTQHMLLLVRCTHQSMLIVMTVEGTESIGTYCRRYPNLLAPGVSTDQFIHCHGNQLKLTDSDLGPEQYQHTDYYVWTAGKATQLLFIFPTRVSLTTITLHYYNDSVRGLPRLTFYAIPKDIDVWDQPIASDPRVDVASVSPDKEPAGRRSVSINVNFNITKVLMYKSSSNFQFAVSEVEFFQCMQTGTV